MLIVYSTSMSTYRIPPSLNWLIRNRRVIAGRIKIAVEDKKLLEQRLEKAQNLIRQHDFLSQKIAVLENDLAAIDRTINLHEIPIDLSQIKDLRPHRNAFFFKSGVLTQSIFKVLSTYPKEWISTTDVAIQVESMTNSNLNTNEFTKLRHVVRTRLMGLAYAGKIDRINTGQVNKEGFWRQKPSNRIGITYSEFPPEDDSLADTHEIYQTDPI